jgi:dTDP-4-dehydrorhamnose 3,5-epimerase
MEFIAARIPGPYLIRRRQIADARGHFARAWCSAEFAEHGLDSTIAQINMAVSIRKGTIRGLHYQRAPHDEAKTVWCTRGSVYDVIVDVRLGSPTRGNWMSVNLTADEGDMLFVPRGFAHGYQTLVDDVELYYLTTSAYAPRAATGFRFDDPAFGIDWPLSVSVVSDQDRGWPAFQP